MRSKLFVPASRPELFAKALAGPADAISFDLEDAVLEDGKAAARAALSDWLRSAAVADTAKSVIVRVNAVGSSHFAADLTALAGCRVDLINLPKVEAPADIDAAVDALAEGKLDARLLVNIESPRGLLRADAIATAHPRVAGLQVGLNDLFAALGADRHDRCHVRAVLWQIRVAAGAADRFAYDGAWPALDDEEGFRHEAELARGMGYLGKSCVHPRQVPIANAEFDAGSAVAAARRLLAAAEAAAAEGRGAFTFQGRMIDRPAIDAARATLAGAR